jgi:hypothetical protein
MTRKKSAARGGVAARQVVVSAVNPLPVPAEPKAPSAWLPLTFRGLAAFGRATTNRTFSVATFAAVLFGLAMVWLTVHSLLPPLDQLTERLPATGEIRGRQFQWGGEPFVLLADSRILTVVVDLEGANLEGRVADLMIKLRRNDLEVCSLFGCATMPYPAGWIVALNQPEVKPLWGAWRPFVVVGVFLVSVVDVLLLWVVIATASFIPVRFVLYFLDRDVTLMGTWRVLLMALLPGAGFLTLGILGYSVHQVSLTGLLVIAVAHVLVDVVYWTGACWRLPLTDRRAAAKAGNPFGSASDNPS